MAKRKTILYLQHANPAAYPPIEYSSRILADDGWDVLMLGVHSDGPQALELPPHPRIRCEVLPYTPPGLKQKLAYLRFARRAFELAHRHEPDWVYVSDSLAAPVGLLLAKVLGCKTIYHEHDSHPPGKDSSSAFMRLVLAARRSLARRAAFNILPQRARIPLFAEETGTTRPIHCAWNCPPRAEAAAGVPRTRAPGEPLAVYFHGSINLERVPLALIEGARLCGFPVRIRVVGYETIGSRGASETLRAAASAAGPDVILELKGSVPSRRDLHRMMEGMHVGWINFMNRSNDPSLAHLAGASNKAFDYLAVGLPLIVPDAPDWKALYVDPGYALACDPADPESIAAALRWFHENPQIAARMGQEGQGRIAAEWNYESQFSGVLERLNQGAGVKP